MQVVVIGLGEVGRHLLGELQREQHDVVAVDSDAEAVEYALDHFDVAALLGYGAGQETLEKAGVANADLVVAVTDNDEVNLLAALAARALGAKRAIARAQGSNWVSWTGGTRRGLLGVDLVINPRLLVADELFKIAQSRGASEIIDLPGSNVTVEQMVVHRGTRAGTRIADLDLPRDVLVAALVSDDGLVIPRGDTVVKKGDRIYVLGSAEAVRSAEKRLCQQSKVRRVCIVGGGVIGEALVIKLLRRGASVAVIERDRKRAEQLSAAHPNLAVVHGDGTDRTLLMEEEIDQYDLVAAVTEADEVNLMAALLAKQTGVPRTACVVNRPGYIEIYRELGIDAVLSPRIAASAQVLRYARSRSLRSLTVLEGGQAEVLEVRAHGGSPGVGRPLRALKMPKGSLVGAIHHNGEVHIARGDTEVRAGDTVVLLTQADVREAAESLFARP